MTSHPAANTQWRILGVWSNSTGLNLDHTSISICSPFNLKCCLRETIDILKRSHWLFVSGQRKCLRYKVPAIAHSFVCLCTERTANGNFNSSIYLDYPWRRADTQYQLRWLKPATKCWARERETAAFHNAAIDMNCEPCQLCPWRENQKSTERDLPSFTSCHTEVNEWELLHDTAARFCAEAEHTAQRPCVTCSSCDLTRWETEAVGENQSYW